MTNSIVRGLLVAALAFLFTLAFFYEYRAGARQVHIPYDLDGFHYPLADYAFQSLRAGRFPEWDPTTYSGLPFVANVQAALFYPPMWLAFAADRARERLHFGTFQDIVFLHIWLAFVFAFLWFRWRKLHTVAAILGAGVFAYSGYLMHQLQHFGLVAGYAWLPLGFWAVDQVHADRRWRPAWKLVVASAMCFLAGYTPFWIVFCICMGAYAVARAKPVRTVLITVAAILVSVGICAVQLLPAMEASGLMVRDFRYGPASRDPMFWLSYIVPNYFNFRLGAAIADNPGMDLLYLGAAGIVGVVLALAYRRAWSAALGVLAVCLILATDPFALVSGALGRWPLGAQLIRGYYFLAGMSAAFAMLAAAGFDRLLAEKRQASAWLSGTGAFVGLGMVAWGVRLLIRWPFRLSDGAASAIDAAAAAILVLAAVLLYRRSAPAVRGILAAGLILMSAAEYKAFGTSKRVNSAEEGPATVSDVLTGIDPEVYRQMTVRRDYRCAVDVGGLYTTKLRHIGLTSPQGFDPLLPTAYTRLIEAVAGWRTDREFEFDPARHDILRLLGVRYFITSEMGPRWERLKADPAYSQMQPPTSYFKVFELRDAQSPYGWEPGVQGDAATQEWAAERRVIRVRSDQGGKFRLSEQYFPGWSARVDGREVAIHRCHEALQCIEAPAGSHEIEFVYRSQSLRTGLAITVASLALCVLIPAAISVRALQSRARQQAVGS